MGGNRAGLAEALQPVLQTALASPRRILRLTRLRGGTKKGVYRAILDDRSAIVYVWDASQSYWPAQYPEAPDTSDPFADASSAELFATAHRCLRSLGVRTPELYLLDTSRTEIPVDVAVVEDIQGGTLEEHWERHPDNGERITSKLGEMLRAMHDRCSSRFGKVAYVENAPQDPRPEQLALRRALAHLDHAAQEIARLRDVREKLEDLLWSMVSTIQPRSEYRLIHGELGPEHVLVDARGNPVIIDFEGLMYFDVEWEHAYLAFRYDEQYRHLLEEGLDEARLHVYTLCLHLSLCSGPLRLVEGGFPEREMMMGIVDFNVSQVLDFVRWGTAVLPAARRRKRGVACTGSSGVYSADILRRRKCI